MRNRPAGLCAPMSPTRGPTRLTVTRWPNVGELVEVLGCKEVLYISRRCLTFTWFDRENAYPALLANMDSRIGACFTITRHGRGPCFSPGGLSPGEMWEEGVGNGHDQKRKNQSGGEVTDDGAELPKPKHPTSDGIFRMASPYIAVEAEEITKHGYTPNLLEAISRPKAADCDPDLQPHIGELKGRAIQEIDPTLVQFLRNPDPSKKWWSYWGYVEKRRALFVVHIAGWQNTLSAPDDIGALTPTCRVFSHVGCSTFKHNYDVVRHQKNWKHEGNERYAYWTTSPSDFAVAHYWVQHWLDYGEFNVFQPLEKSLKNAVKTTNKNLKDDRDKCRVK
jgi:hypothetical protein